MRLVTLIIMAHGGQSPFLGPLAAETPSCYISWGLSRGPLFQYCPHILSLTGLSIYCEHSSDNTLCNSLDSISELLGRVLSRNQSPKI